MGQAELQAELEAQIDGEVRFDRISRALYSTDASVYQIGPLGVVILKIARGRRPHGGDRAASRRVHHDARRRHVAGRAGDRRRPSCSTCRSTSTACSKSTRGALGARRAGRGPRRAERAAAAARAALRAGYFDREPRHHRRHDGEQFERRALSVLYGKTIDHVLEQTSCFLTVARAFPAAGCRGLDARVRRRWPRSRVLSHGAARGRGVRGRDRPPLSESAAASRRLQPRRIRRSRQPVNLAKMMVGSEGTLGHRPRSQDQSGPAAESEGRDGDRVRRSARSARCDTGHPPASSVGGRGDGQVHPRSHAPERGRSIAPTIPCRDDPAGALLCVEFYDDTPGDLPPRLDALERELEQSPATLPHAARHDARGAGPHLELARSRARACRWR